MTLTAVALAAFLGSVDPDALGVSINVDTERRALVSFTNTDDEAVCLALNNGLRLVDLRRDGLSVPFAAELPSSPPPYCHRVDPGEERSWDFDLSFIFPDVRPGDQLCFEVWSRPPGAEAHSQRWVCSLIE